MADAVTLGDLIDAVDWSDAVTWFVIGAMLACAVVIARG